jgi:tRNA threonylcarbamoyladenosine biosynthesis protein TsaE
MTTEVQGRSCHLADEAATLVAGAELARRLPAGQGAVIYLHGPLGAGKTCFVRGLLRALGYTGPVRSPTYTLLETYALAGREIWHLDLYRLADPGEVEYLGLRDAPPEAVLLIEWPDQGRGALPPASLEIHLTPEGDGRRLTFTP